MPAKERIKELEKKLTQASEDYYNGTATLSDKVYDAWKDELTKLDPTNPAVVAVGAPVKPSAWEKHTHLVPMGSLNKVNSVEELTDWSNGCGVLEYLLTEKLDGLSVSLQYENGIFIGGYSRGDGSIGENITQNVRKMEGVQITLPLHPKNPHSKFTGHIRGEIVLRRSNHKKYFSDYANPRNAASGISKRLDGKGNEYLTVICYSIEGNRDFDTELDLFKALDEMGFITPLYKVVSLSQACKEWRKYQDVIRDTLDYDIDGLVIRVNDMAAQIALGDKNHRPKGAIAFKFDAALAETTIRDVIWQVGDTGRLTPVANFDPVSLMGATVSRASLYNLSYIRELGLDIGATVLVKRANDVIPRCEELVKGTGKILSAPEKCPACNGVLINDGEYIRCTNNRCPPQIRGRINKWVKELGILEWGAKIIQKMIDAGLISDIADIYRLKAEDISGLDKLGDKSALNLIAELDKYREVSLENLIGGLTINNIATSSVKLITSAGYDKLDDLFNLTESQLESIPGFGSIRAEAFVGGIAENRRRIDDILSAGVKIKDRVKGSLTGKSFCFTGEMSIPRKKLHQMVVEAGGDVEKHVSKGLTYLVTDDPDSASKKAQAARKLGTLLISEADFAKMVSRS